MIIPPLLNSGHAFFVHSFEIMIVIGLIFTTIGFKIGNQMWSHSAKETLRLEQLNKELRKREQSLRKTNAKLEVHLDLLK